MKKLLQVIGAVTVFSTFAAVQAQACPEGYHQECDTDPCGDRRVEQRCVRWEDGQCVDWRQEVVCVPRTRCTCEHD